MQGGLRVPHFLSNSGPAALRSPRNGSAARAPWLACSSVLETASAPPLSSGAASSREASAVLRPMRCMSSLSLRSQRRGAGFGCDISRIRSEARTAG
eukprot:6187987-Pleurochrysis_carterae.AAC.3